MNFNLLISVFFSYNFWPIRQKMQIYDNPWTTNYLHTYKHILHTIVTFSSYSAMKSYFLPLTELLFLPHLNSNFHIRQILS